MHDNHFIQSVGSVTMVMMSNFSVRASSCFTLSRSATSTQRGGCTAGLTSGCSVSECTPGNSPMPSNRSEYSARS